MREKAPTPIRIPKVDPNSSIKFTTAKGTFVQYEGGYVRFTLTKGMVIEGIEFKSKETISIRWGSQIGDFAVVVPGDEVNKLLKARYLETLRTIHKKP